MRCDAKVERHTTDSQDSSRLISTHDEALPLRLASSPPLTSRDIAYINLGWNGTCPCLIVYIVPG